MNWKKLSSPNRLAKYAGDLVLITLAYYLAFHLRFDGYILPQFWAIFVNSLPLVLLTKVVLLHHYHLYDSFWRHTGLTELKALLKANSAALLVITTSYALTAGLTGYPRSVFLLDWLLSFIFLAVFRIAPRILRENGLQGLSSLKNGSRKQKSAAKNVVLYGAGDLGVSIARQIQQTYSTNKNVLGFIDDDASLHGSRICGVEILGDRSVLPSVAAKKRIDEIIVTISAISGEKLKDIVELCQRVCPNVQVAPGLDELFMGKVRISDLREVQIEDLLGREKIQLEETRLQEFLHGKRVLVTGAGGSIGSELCFQILKFNPEKLLLLGRGENSIYNAKVRLSRHARPDQLEEVIADVINFVKVDKVFKRYQPQIVFHAAADKHVPLMELNPDESVLNNVIGTQNVLEAAEKHRVEKVVCISTDKAVNPTSIMGCCKRVTELLVQDFDAPATTACAVRFGNVLGSRGSVIPLFNRQIAAGGPVTVTHPDIKRYFMTIPEAVLLVLQAGSISTGGEIFLLEMGKPIRIVDLARQMIRLCGVAEEKIGVEFVGLRPGEKLEEELAFADERLERTEILKLYRLSGERAKQFRVDGRLQILKQLAIEMDFGGIQEVLKDLVPEYRSTTVYAADRQAPIREQIV